MSSYIRILHASPDAPAVDVYADGKLIAQNLSFANFTEYQPLTPGSYNIKVYPAGTATNPVINTSLDLPDRSIYTAAVTGRLDDISLLPVPDTPMAATPGKVSLRFVHLSPDTPTVDITLPDGTVLFRNVSFKDITDYLAVDPGTYTLQARAAGTDRVLLNVPNQTFTGGRFYTAYAVGLAGGTPPLQLLTALDGNTYIKF